MKGATADALCTRWSQIRWASFSLDMQLWIPVAAVCQYAKLARQQTLFGSSLTVYGDGDISELFPLGGQMVGSRSTIQ